MELTCPNCSQTIDSKNINIATDLAKCGYCGAIYKASDLVSAIEDKTLASPPKGSKIEVTREAGDGVKLYLPKKGFAASDLAQFAFVTFWLCFICFWTWGASQGSVFFALFSIPFWLIGFTMLAGVINSINETQTVTVNGDELIVEKRKPINSKRFKFNFTDIQSIKMKHLSAGPFSGFSNPRYMWRLQWSRGAGIMLPAVISGTGTQYFFEAANDAEQEWVTAYLNNKLKLVRK